MKAVTKKTRQKICRTKSPSKPRRGTALVTGASRGIGKAIASALASAAGRSRAPAGTRSVSRRRTGSRASATSRWTFRGRASVEALVKKLKNVDVLVNNAGSGSIGPVEEAPIEKVRALFEDNFFGAVRLTQAVLPAHARTEVGGPSIFIGSMAGEAPRAFSSFYAASKSALRAFAECLRMEVRGYGIRVALVAPWFIATTFPQETQVKKGSPYAAAVQRVKQVRDRLHHGRARAAGRGGSGHGPAREEGTRGPSPSVGRHARILAFLVRHLPRGTVEALSARRFKL